MDELFTIKEIADSIGVDKQRISRYIKKEGIEAHSQLTQKQLYSKSQKRQIVNHFKKELTSDITESKTTSQTDSQIELNLNDTVGETVSTDNHIKTDLKTTSQKASDTVLERDTVGIPESDTVTTQSESQTTSQTDSKKTDDTVVFDYLKECGEVVEPKIIKEEEKKQSSGDNQKNNSAEQSIIELLKKENELKEQYYTQRIADLENIINEKDATIAYLKEQIVIKDNQIAEQSELTRRIQNSNQILAISANSSFFDRFNPFKKKKNKENIKEIINNG